MFLPAYYNCQSNVITDVLQSSGHIDQLFSSCLGVQRRLQTVNPLPRLSVLGAAYHIHHGEPCVQILQNSFGTQKKFHMRLMATTWSMNCQTE